MAILLAPSPVPGPVVGGHATKRELEAATFAARATVLLPLGRLRATPERRAARVAAGVAGQPTAVEERAVDGGDATGALQVRATEAVGAHAE